MEIFSWIRFILGALFIIAGIVFYCIQFIGLFRFKYVLNRMHAAAIGDTFGIDFILIGAIIMNGFSMASLKLLFILLFLMFTSPVSSHMLARLEVASKLRITECCPCKDVEELEEDA